MLLCLVAGAAEEVSPWADCDASKPTARGPFKSDFANLTYDKTTMYVQYPLGPLPKGVKAWPAVVFMHGMCLSWFWYEYNIQHFVSHGMVVVFPFAVSPGEDNCYHETLTEPQAVVQRKSLRFLEALVQKTVPAIKGLEGSIDLTNVAFAGHSMGGADAIRGTSREAKGAIKLTLALHPALCGDGPPPPPDALTNEEFVNASTKSDLLLFTAESDYAFSPMEPLVAGKELACWKAATGTALFASFRNTTCDKFPPCENMQFPWFSNASTCSSKFLAFGKGHLCPLNAPGVKAWVNPELSWSTAALRLYLQHGNAKASKCHDLIWGKSKDSFQNSPDVVEFHTHAAAPTAYVV